MAPVLTVLGSSIDHSIGGSALGILRMVAFGFVFFVLVLGGFGFPGFGFSVLQAVNAC